MDHLSKEMEWSPDEKKELLTNILQIGGISCNAESYKTVEATLNWENAKLYGKSVEECKTIYQSLISKVIKYRTMKEIIDDAMILMSEPSQTVEEQMSLTPTSSRASFLCANGANVKGLHVGRISGHGASEEIHTDFCGKDENMSSLAVCSLASYALNFQLHETENLQSGQCKTMQNSEILNKKAEQDPISLLVPDCKRSFVNVESYKENNSTEDATMSFDYVTKQRLNEVNELVNVIDYQILTSGNNTIHSDSSDTLQTGTVKQMLESTTCSSEKDIKHNLRNSAMREKMQSGSKKYTSVKIHKCSVCGVGVCGISNLKAHMRIHTGEKPYKCDLCELEFNRKEQQKRHRRTHTGEKPFQCDVCGLTFSRIEQRQRHKRKHTGEKPYSCDICGLHFAYSGSLTSHRRRHTGERPYQCSICGGRFSHKCSLNAHVRIHTGEKPYTCDICGMAFTHQTKQKAHRRKHTGETMKCDICGVELCGMGSLKIHRVIHSGEKPFKCDVCGLQFIQKGNLQTHKRIHTGERPYQCDICGVDFIDSGGLQKHRRIHTGERPFKCDICGAAFIGSSALKNHRRIHTGEKPFKCEICGGAFAHSSRLKEHIRKHTGEKPYKCDVCSSAFATSSTLKQHKRIHTGEKPYRCIVCGMDFSHKEQQKRHYNKVHIREKYE